MDDRSVTPPPPLLHAHMNAPFDPYDYLHSPPPVMTADDDATGRTAAGPAARLAAAGLSLLAPPGFVSASPHHHHTLSTVRSHPALPLSRQPGLGRVKVKDMAKSFEGAATQPQSPSATFTTRENHRRAAMPSTNGHKSPRKLQKSPSVEAVNMRGHPHESFSPRRAKSPSKSAYTSSRPLFGEITADGKWNGNFDLQYGPLPTFEKAPRRGSEGSIALRHGRSQSHQDIFTPALAPPATQRLNHKRSRSDMDALNSSTAANMSANRENRGMYPTPPDSANRGVGQRSSPMVSRIPVSRRHNSTDSNASSTGQSRAPSAMSNPPGRRRLEKSPIRTGQAMGKENHTPSNSRNRYHPPPISTSQSGQTLSAKIVAPAQKTSPPLRSSRPRQPVSSATTAASRARAAERAQGPNASPRDGRRPSEQWLGKPYDPQKERSRRKIPELDKINFEERRARIQRAISQSLKSNASQESLRSQARSQSRSASSRAPSRLTSHEHTQVHPGAEIVHTSESVEGDRLQNMRLEISPAADELNMRPDGQSRGLSVATTGIQDLPGEEAEPLTSHTDRTMFEDESPILGRPATAKLKPAAEEAPVLLAPATYQPPSRTVPTSTRPSESQTNIAAINPKYQQPTLLDDIARLRDRSASSASDPANSSTHDNSLAELSPEDSSSDLDDKWGLGNGPAGDEGSIRIMLDDDPSLANHSAPWSQSVQNQFDGVQSRVYDGDLSPSQNYYLGTSENNQSLGTSIDTPDGFVEDEIHQATPRKRSPVDEANGTADATTHETDLTQEGAPSDFAQMLDYFQSTGTLTAEMIEHAHHHMVDLHRISANGGSNAIMIQSLLDSILDARPEVPAEDKALLDPRTYEIPDVTPDTPPLDASFQPGTVTLYHDHSHLPEEDDDFAAKIRKADEEWERQQRGESMLVHRDVDEEERPPPPPKDYGYTPRSSTCGSSIAFPPSLPEASLMISRSGQLDLPNIQTASERVNLVSSQQSIASPLGTPAPPLPSHAPPPPPPVNDASLSMPFVLPDIAAAKAYSERASSELSPRHRKNWAASGSSRPSMDSQRVPPQLPSSQSMTSFSESTRQASIDTAGDGQTKLAQIVSPGPEQKRLLKRRHIIRELLDTENSYHQDLKIIEDIYKATCTPELVAPEDKKVLFGNCDEIERFALQFYDELRRASNQVYVPPKQQRWMNKRGSFSTTQSDGTTQTTMTDAVDEEKDRTTRIGRTFLDSLAQMEKVYGAYLRNHDAANQRLCAIQGVTTVKCWLDECHANASDITAAWDLDSLLVKPTQRVAKYPMLLQQLLETTPAEHPDHDDLKVAARDMISMLTRINDAKKRADLVEQIISRKSRKESDVRSGLAKAFGRRAEKLKERVGIAEAFQDPDFDELAHKFGGHFIRLQICMRDVQDYVQRTDKAIDLINNYAAALELFMDVKQHKTTETVAKWHRYGQIIRELTLVAFGEHKADVQKRVLAPMIQCIKLHEGPQNAINKRKKRIVDYAKCKSEERRGLKPDKRTVDASDAYVALNETLKIELPKLYGLTAQLVQNCLHCFLDIQLKWQSAWERKLRPVLEASDFPHSIQEIEPAFRPDFAEVEKELHQLAICNGSLKLDTAGFLSPPLPSADSLDHSSSAASRRRPSTMDSSSRTLSVGSESSANAHRRRHSGIYTPASDVHQPSSQHDDGRMRSNSSMSARTPPVSNFSNHVSANRPWSNSTVNTPTSSFSLSRPPTGNNAAGVSATYMPRQSSDSQWSPRPPSDATYFTARPDMLNDRFSGVFTSALPPDMPQSPQRPMSPARTAPEDMNVLFVCASLFEFSIDRTRREAGYPYLQYVQGEVFDVVAQKGELWLAKNQDDSSNELGWIWEQHFIILSSDN